ncbi:MAG TPA: DUF1858 domain-containing protein [Clostridia bacterium]|nr:DUF1858 domain-containing protein [Clostridia bacterium]
MITKDMTLMELMQRFPQTQQYLKSINMHCSSCMGAVNETIEMAARQHGMDVDELLAELNRLVRED